MAEYFLPNLSTAYPQNGVAIKAPMFNKLPNKDISVTDIGYSKTVELLLKISIVYDGQAPIKPDKEVK